MISLAAIVLSLVSSQTSKPSFTRVAGLRSALDHAEDVVLAEDEVVLAVELHLGARVLAEEDVVPLLDVEVAHRAVLEHLAVAHRDDGRLDRLLLRGVRDVEPALRPLLFLHPTNDH